MEDRNFGCISYIFEITGWIVNIIQLIVYLRSGFFDFGSPEPIIFNNIFLLALLSLYGLSAEAAFIWNHLMHRDLSGCGSFFYFAVLHCFLSAVLLIPLSTQISRILFPFKSVQGFIVITLGIWLGFLILSALIGWVFISIRSAPKVK